MAIVSAAFGFFMTGSGRPRRRQVKQAVPMHAVHDRQKQLSRTLKAKGLNFFSAKRRNTRLRDPDRLAGNGADFIDLFRPVPKLPVVPVERKAVYGDHIHGIQHAVRAEQLNKMRVNGRDAAQHYRQLRVLASNGLAGGYDHIGEPFPIGVELEIPM